MTVPLRCPSCGTPCKSNDSFCGACGADLAPNESKAPAAAAARPEPAPNRTMLGLPGAPAMPTPQPRSEATPEPAAPPAAAAPRPIALKTMMGMTSPFVAGLQTPLHAQKAEPKPEAEAKPELSSSKPVPAGALSAADASKRTVMGVAPPADVAKAIREANAAGAVPAHAAKPAAPAAPPASAGNLNKTIVGMSAPPQFRAPDARPEQAPAALAAPRTFTTPMAQAPAPPTPVATPESKASPKSDRTMLGHAAVAPSDPPPDENSRSSSVPSGRPSYAHGRPSDDFLQARPGQASPVRALLAALAGALVVLALGLTAWHFLSGGPELRVAVVQSEEGEALEVVVPAPAPGTKVRFLGNEQELKSGTARFPLAADALALGENELVIGVVHGEPGAQPTVDTTSVQLHVAYRARVDLAGLAKQPATLDVVIDALPGSEVTVDGKKLTLDAKGHGLANYPIAAQSAAKLPFAVKYTVKEPGAGASEAALSLNLPVSSLQIDRPGPSVTTDQSSIEVAGAVESAATVTVDGAAVKVNEGRFLSRVKLPKAGQYTIQVLAQLAGKVPRQLDLSVSRVTDLSVAAAGFQADSSLNYAKIAQNPVIYRGQNVAFEGRVYNVEVKGSASHLQMLVRDCPGAQRCPLWVELPQATDATNDAWVRVLGTVAGEQQFRSERGQVHTVPSVKAEFVLKLAK